MKNNEKLVIVSVLIHGKRRAVLSKSIIDSRGKTIVNRLVVEDLLSTLRRGDTYSLS